MLAIVCIGLALALKNAWFVAAAPIIGYAFAWYAHFFVEHNKPATFGHPLYSLAADYRMLFLMMAGKMDAEVARAHVILSRADGERSVTSGRIA